ncbi:MAG: metalloregulator ArsR/SmtB family transcription factor [Aerococcaceae bacterium]|nr:metalloregulator ArsR/SmtB family transcription factor [Aerococcaceae bacterium]
MSDYACLDAHSLERERKKVQELIQLENIEKQAHFFKILGDVNRVKIMHVLMHYDRLSVNDIAQLIDATIATTSHHLITLKNGGLITSDKDGKYVLYFLENQLICNLIGLAKQLKAKCPICGQIHE